MSVAVPARRLLSSHPLGGPVSIRPLLHHPRRSALGDSFRRAGSSQKPQHGKAVSDNPILEEYMRKHSETLAPSSQQQTPQAVPEQGDIAASSIFEDERRIAARQKRERDDGGKAKENVTKVGGIARNPTAIARVVHPDPNARQRWERKKVIQMIKSGGRLSKAQFIKRTEREHLAKSHNMKTSVKKLGMIARQIAGKTIDDAITQMRFSTKKVAQEVLKQLEQARDEAIVMRGMGLGKSAPSDHHQTRNRPSANVTGPAQAAALTAATEAEAPRTIEIQLPDGKRHQVEDRSTIYIAQAWVGRGPYGQLPDYRARGRIFMMRTPWTSLSVVLKEEATRIREHAEREAKRRRKITENRWVPLPDRPITTHRQWYSW